MVMNEFEVRSYGGQELAVFYGLDLMPASAGKRLEERKEDVDSPAGEDDRTISG